MIYRLNNKILENKYNVSSFSLQLLTSSSLTLLISRTSSNVEYDIVYRMNKIYLIVKGSHDFIAVYMYWIIVQGVTFVEFVV